MNRIELDYAQLLSDIANATRLGFLSGIIENSIKPALIKLDNVTFVEKITDNTTFISKFIFNVGLQNILLYYEVVCTGNNNKINIGLCKNDESYTSIAVQSMTSFSYSNTSNFHQFIGTFYFISNNNKLNAIYNSCSAGIPEAMSTYIVLDKDNFGNAFVYCGGVNLNLLYYDNDENLMQHTIDTTHINNNSAEYVWLANVEIILNNNLKGLTSNLLKICNGILSTNTAQSGQLIDVDGIKYRKLNGSFWFMDNDEQ